MEPQIERTWYHDAKDAIKLALDAGLDFIYYKSTESTECHGIEVPWEIFQDAVLEQEVKGEVFKVQFTDKLVVIEQLTTSFECMDRNFAMTKLDEVLG